MTVLLLASMLLLHLWLAWTSRQDLRKGYADFRIFYTAGKLLRSGLGHQLYDTATQLRVQQSFSSIGGVQLGLLPYNHPPFEALIFVPFALFSYFRAYLLWCASNLLLLFCIPIVLRCELPRLRRVPPVLWWLFSLAFFPVAIAILQGQDSVLFLLLLSLAFVAFRRQRDFLCGCLLGLATFRFHLLLPLVLMLLLSRKVKVLLGCSLVVLGLVLGSAAVIGWHTAVSYPDFLWGQEHIFATGTNIVSAMPNLRGFLAIFGLSNWSAAACIIATVVGVGVIAIATKKPMLTQSLDLQFSSILALTALASYHVLIHDLSMLLLPIYFLLDRLQAGQIPTGWKRIALISPILVLFLTPLQMLLWFRYARVGLLAPVLLFWFVGLVAEISASSGTGLAIAFEAS